MSRQKPFSSLDSSLQARWHFILLQAALLIFTTLVGLSRAEANAKKSTADSTELTDSFAALAIVISTELISAKEEKNAQKICQSIARQLQPETGPFGFGLFPKSECRIGKKTIGESVEEVDWVLRIQKRDSSVQVTLSMVTEQRLMRQATVAVPQFKSRQAFIDAFTDQKFTWILALNLLDQLPVLSRLHTKIVSADGTKLQTISDQNSKEYAKEISFEPIPVRAVYREQEKLWSISVYRNKIDVNSAARQMLFVANAAGRATNLEKTTALLQARAEQIDKMEEMRKAAQLEASARNKASDANDSVSSTNVPLIEERDSLLWVKGKFAVNTFTGNSTISLFSEVSLGTDRFYLRNILLSHSITQFPYMAYYFDTSTNTEGSSALLLSEQTWGLGLFELFQISKGFWIIPLLHMKLLEQGVTKLQSESEFEPLRESNLPVAGLSLGFRIKTGSFLNQLQGGAELIVPYFDQYLLAYGEIDSQYIVLERTKRSSTSDPDAAQKSSSFQLSIGPLFRLQYTSMSKFFPAKGKNDPNTPSAQLEITDFVIGIGAYASF